MRFRKHHSARLGIALLAFAAAAVSGTRPAFGQIPSAPRSVSVHAGSATAPNATVAVSPATVTIQPRATVQFTATVSGTTNTSVVWTSTGGSVTATGAYTAGLTTGTFRVTATVSGGTIAGSATVTIGSSSTTPTIQVTPGQSIQSAVNSVPEGAVILLKAGVHRMQTVTPKSNQTLVGEPGAVLSGARLLTAFTRSGSYWVASGQTQQGGAHGECRSGYPRCSYPEDLYINDVMQRHVGTLAEVGPGEWHFDYANDRIYFYDDPTSRRVETTVTRQAITGSASNVRIRGLVVEKFASPAQAGAIVGDSTTGWTVEDAEIRFNHGMGLRIGNGMKVLRNRVHHNGQLGMGGIGNDVLVEGNEISHNNAAGYNPGWEAGATKFVKTNHLVVRNNFVHHNSGPGLWTDIENRNTLYEANRVEDNDWMGIFHEISYSAVIRNNTVRRNGFGNSGWLWGAGIAVAASPDVEIHGNIVEANADGIAAVQQPRGSGPYGAYQISNLWVHDNTVVMTQGQTGFVQDLGDNSYFTSRNNRFDRNTYRLGPNARYFAWMNAERTEAEWRSYGNDTNGTFTR